MLLKKLDTTSLTDLPDPTDSSIGRKFNHHLEPTVIDRPELVRAIIEALKNQDDVSLASLVSLHGLPPDVRAEAWPVLLRNHPYVLNPKFDINTSSMNEADLPLKKIRNDIKRWCRNNCDSEAINTAIVEFLTKYGNDIKYGNQMVWVADFLLNGDQKTYPLSPRRSPTETPIGSPRNSVSPLGSPSRASFRTPIQTPNTRTVFSGVSPNVFNEVFTNVMLVMHHTPPQYGKFISLLRTLMPELDQHFAYEGVLSGIGGDVWLVWWLQWYGIRAMPSTLVCRLWDQYFSMRTPGVALTDLHMFNCLMVIKENSLKLLELDQSEIRQFLWHVPRSIDIEAVILEARTLSRIYKL